MSRTETIDGAGATPRTRGLLVGAAALALLAAAAGDSGTRSEPTRAIARLEPTESHDARGIVRFESDGEGLAIHSQVSGLHPGAHAYHVHVYGDCSAPDAKSAGPHFDFRGPDAPENKITGNLGELVASVSGEARAEGRVENAKLSGPNSIVGRAVVVHARGNDPDHPPDGRAGPRVACGVIGIAEPHL